MATNHSKVGKRCDHYALENAHPDELHYDSGQPVFVAYTSSDGRWHEKHVHKKVTFYTSKCPECGSDTRYDHRAMQSCLAECGGIAEPQGPPLDYSRSSAGRYC